jgi:plastocyanin
MSKRTGLLLAVSLVGGLLTSCGSSTPAGNNGTPTPSPTTAPDAVISIVGIAGGMSFSPAVVTVKVGQKIGWKNTDSTTHRMVDNGGAFDSGSLGPGSASTIITMNTAGSFPYHCSIHPTMTGTITVTP